MSNQLINRSADLKRLRDDGFDIEVRGGYLLMKHIPHVTCRREVKFGALVSALVLKGDVTGPPDNHVVYFAGEQPCRENGVEIEQIKRGSGRETLGGGIVVDRSFSAKPIPSGNYEDYFAKMTTYEAILSRPAQLLDPVVTAKTFPPIEPEQEDNSPFHYIDTASSRADIGGVTQKLESWNIAIIGLGGTGAYVLDLVAKTPVKEIHLFDGDLLFSHNAFRSPGAPSIDELRAGPPKVVYFKGLYSKMHRGIIEHAVYIGTDNLEQLQGFDFVFLCIDRGPAKKLIVERLESLGICFIDAGMGLDLTDGSLGGIVRVTASTPTQRDHLRRRVSFAEGDHDNVYDRNIQISDLNCLNGALAVVRWKKMLGFYRDLEQEHFSAYTVDGNALANEDRTWRA
jgi:hypothetical protein